MTTKMYYKFPHQTFSSVPGFGCPPPLRRTAGTGSDDVFGVSVRGILACLRFCLKSWHFLPTCLSGRTSDMGPAVRGLCRGMVPGLQSPAVEPSHRPTKEDEECPSTRATPRGS